jgi:hypothetical protein
MSITFFDFLPPPRSAFRFSPILEGATYAAVCTWNLFGRRWYLSLYSLDNRRILTVPMVGSPDPLMLVAATWDPIRRQGVVSTAVPHRVPIGAVVQRTVRGISPTSYDGRFDLRATTPTGFVYDLNVDPGPAEALGSVAADVNLLGSYATTATIVYRETTKQLEVGP